MTDIKQGDVLEVTKSYPDNYFDALLSDFPYGLKFMGKEWDKGVPSVECCGEILRVMKPGAWCMVFGGTRTWHRLAVALEDAGFEIKDTLMWLHGMGFPKSFDISKGIDKEAGEKREIIGEYKMPQDSDAGNAGKPTIQRGNGGQFTAGGNVLITQPATPAAKQWQGYGTALKPAWEPILLIRKPLDKNNVNNALQWGTGGLNIDGGRIPTQDDLYKKPLSPKGWGNSSKLNGSINDNWKKGRWPANVILDEESAGMLDDMSGESKGTGLRFNKNNKHGNRAHEGYCRPNASMYTDDVEGALRVYGDSGGASRFFYCAKASRSEREAGLEEFGLQQGIRTNAPRESEEEKTQPTKNHHPTVKPLALCKYLATLLLPPPRENTTNGNARKLYVPFCGSGSEMIGALQAGWDSVTGIEIDAEYIKIANARIAYALKQERNKAPLFAGVT